MFPNIIYLAYGYQITRAVAKQCEDKIRKRFSEFVPR